MTEDTRRISDGEPLDGKSVKSVDSVPQEFRDWVENNRERMARAKSLPYFLRDNGKMKEGKYVLNSFGKTAVKPPHAEEYISHYGGKVMVSPLHGNDELKSNVEIGKKTADFLNETVYLLPRIDPKMKNASVLREKYLPKGVYENKNPDFLIAGSLFDGKKFTNVSEDVSSKFLKQSIENHIKKAKKQADNMIFLLPDFVKESFVRQVMGNYLSRTSKKRRIIVFLGDRGYIYENTSGH